MIFISIILLTALTLSGVAAYYSVTGLVAIFSALPIPIIIMGATLEVGKIVATVWLHNNWQRAGWAFKTYLVPAVVILMFLTSVGIFGLLSKAHSDQSLVSGDSMSKIAIYDEKIATERENITQAKRALEQMNAQVDQMLGRSDTERGAERAVSIRKQQARERSELQRQVEVAQKNIARLQQERAPLAAENRKIEAEVGPIKYIAALIYGDNPDQNILERAVRWVIIIIVAVFDPLALVLILAAQQSIRWAREDREQQNNQIQDEAKPVPLEKEPEPPVAPLEDPPPESDPELTAEEIEKINAIAREYADDNLTATEPNYEPDDAALTQQQVADIQSKASEEYPEMASDLIETQNLFVEPTQSEQKPEEENTDREEVSQEHAPTANAGDGNLPPQNEPEKLIKKSYDVASIIYNPNTNTVIVTDVTPDQPNVKAMVSGYWDVDGKRMSTEVFENQYPELSKKYINNKTTDLVADNVEHIEITSGFGTHFPDKPKKGDTFLRVDHEPNALFKFSGTKWIEINKDNTDVYVTDDYANFLIKKLESGEYELEQLTDVEQEVVANKLKEMVNQNDNTQNIDPPTNT